MNDVISRQAAIEVINAVFPVDPMKSEYAQGIACGAALAKTYVEQLPSAQQWIPCSERLPEEDNWLGGSGKQFSDSVLMTVLNTIEDEKIIDYGYTTDGEWYSETTECYIPHGWKVIAWMPLPEPYNGEQA